MITIAIAKYIEEQVVKNVRAFRISMPYPSFHHTFLVHNVHTYTQ